MVQSVATSSKNSAEILTVLDSPADLKQTVSGREEFQSQLSSASNSIEQRNPSKIQNADIEARSTADKPVETQSRSGLTNNSSSEDDNQASAKQDGQNSSNANAKPDVQNNAIDTPSEENESEPSLVFVNQDIAQADAEELLDLFSKIKTNSKNDSLSSSEEDDNESFAKSLFEVLEASNLSISNENSGAFEEAVGASDSGVGAPIQDTDVALSESLPEGANLAQSPFGTIESDGTEQLDEGEIAEDEHVLTSSSSTTNTFNVGAATRSVVEEFASPDEILSSSSKSTTSNVTALNATSDSSFVKEISDDNNPVAQALTTLLAEGEDKVQALASQIGLAVSQNAGVSQAVAKEVSGALKSVLSEINNQLQKGTELNINLSDIVEAVSQRLSTANVQVSPEQLSTLVQQVPAAINSVVQTLTDPESLTHRVGVDTQIAGEIQQTQAETARLSPTSQSSDRGVALGRSEAAQQLADKVQVIVNQKNLSAEIKLDPQELGSLQVRVQLNGDQAQVNFTVQNQSTRDLLEQAVPRLRELLQDKGIELGQSSVQQEQRQGQNHDSDNQSGQFASESESVVTSSEEVIETKVVNGHLGAIDYFA